MATKEHRKQAKGLIEGLECRVHVGPPIHAAEIMSAREFLRESEFSPASDYHNRLAQIQDRLAGRSQAPALPPGKRNYGGEAAGYWMQVQSAYDHVILSTCYEGEFNSRQGRIKVSHRFNQAGRIDFVELKFLRSLDPVLTGAFRKLVMVKDFSSIRKDWRATEAYVLEVLPRELVFLFEDIFRCAKGELFAWLINIGHRLAGDLQKELSTGSLANGAPRSEQDPNSSQLCLSDLRADPVALPILEQAGSLESVVEVRDAKTVGVSY